MGYTSVNEAPTVKLSDIQSVYNRAWKPHVHMAFVLRDIKRFTIPFVFQKTKCAQKLWAKVYLILCEPPSNGSIAGIAKQ